MFHLVLEQGRSATTMLVAAGAVIALTAALYRRAFGSLAPTTRRTLLSLRIAAIVLVVLLLFRPVLSMERDQVQRRSVVFLLDASASMATADDATGATRFEQARVRVLDWIGKLSRDFDVHLIPFADRATPLERPGDLSRVEPEGQATSISRALLNAGARVPKRNVEAVVVFSDGLHNTAGDPVAVAKKLGVVVHAIGVGNSLKDNSSYRDVRLTGLECPEQLPVNNEARLTAQIGQAGLAGEVVTVALEEDGRTLASRQVVLQGTDAPQAVELTFVPTVKGRHTYTATVPPVPGEKIAENNRRSVVTQVVDAHIRVLYLEGTLRAEYGAIVQRFLSKDPDVEFCALVQTRPNVFQRRTNIEGLKLDGIPSVPAAFEGFDVIVIGDLDATYWKAPAVEALVKRVREGAGLLMLGGYHGLGPGGYGGNAVEAILPMTLGDRDVGQVTEPFLPIVTPEGRSHPILANIARFFPAAGKPPEVSGLPSLDGCTRVKTAKPGASVLAVHPGEGAMPVLAVQPVGKGRAAVFTGDTTRNWQQTMKALDQETPFLRFWGQMVRWLANRDVEVKAEAGVEVRAEKAYYEPDSTVVVLASVRDRDGEGSDRAEVTARVQGPRGASETVTLRAVPGSSGQYQGSFDPKQPGMYQVFVDAALDGATLHAEKALVEVGRPNLEFDRVDLDDRLLAAIAGATGGRYAHISTADRLLDDLDRKQRRSRVALEQPLYWPGPFWLLFTAALTTEWLVRRRHQLR